MANALAHRRKKTKTALANFLKLMFYFTGSTNTAVP